VDSITNVDLPVTGLFRLVHHMLGFNFGVLVEKLAADVVVVAQIGVPLELMLR
jgi:hypothetical protein